MDFNVKIKRIYEEPAADDGYRILIDRLWPRGVKKDDAMLNEWNKEIAPSDELRRWFDHERERFDEFARMYKRELAGKKEELRRILEISEGTNVTLLYASKDSDISHASALLSFLKNEL